jgi:hypothetical protein
MHVGVEIARKTQAVLVLMHVWERPIWLTGYERQLPSDVMGELLPPRRPTSKRGRSRHTSWAPPRSARNSSRAVLVVRPRPDAGLA